jgi:hypothetical protein
MPVRGVTLGYCVLESASRVSTDYSMKTKHSQYFAVKPSLCTSMWTCLATVCGRLVAVGMISQGATCLRVGQPGLASALSWAGRRRGGGRLV